MSLFSLVFLNATISHNEYKRLTGLFYISNLCVIKKSAFKPWKSFKNLMKNWWIINRIIFSTMLISIIYNNNTIIIIIID